jgi:sulfur relay (sulfurtransferase) DsrC/TusE family protein
MIGLKRQKWVVVKNLKNFFHKFIYSFPVQFLVIPKDNIHNVFIDSKSSLAGHWPSRHRSVSILDRSKFS